MTRAFAIDVLSEPCRICGALAGERCFDDAHRMEQRLNKLYLYAISCALSALVHNAERYGRGWYHFANGELIVVREIAL